MPKPGYLLNIKYIAVVLLLLSCAFTTKAQYQTRPRVIFGCDLISFGVGPYGENFPFGVLGLTGKFELPVDKSPFSFTGSLRTAFYFPATKHSDYVKPLWVTFIPVQVGGRYYLDRLYIEGEGGVSFCPDNNVAVFSAKSIAPQISAGIGYGFRFDKAEQFGLDISLRYDNRIETVNPARSYGSFNYIAINAAFSLGL